MLFNVCSAITVESCVLPVLRGWVWYGCCYLRKKALLQCFTTTEMGLYEVPLSMSLLGFGVGAMLANFHMCFKYLMFSLSGPYDFSLIFLRLKMIFLDQSKKNIVTFIIASNLPYSRPCLPIYYLKLKITKLAKSHLLFKFQLDFFISTFLC